MQPTHPSVQLRQMLGQQLAVGAAFAAEAVVRRAIGTDGDHGEGGRCIEVLQVVQAHAFLLQGLPQTPAQVVGGQPGQQRHIDAQAPQADGDVERRAAGNRPVVHC
ncbi:hypothetical protein D3C84_727920 [compost metagenome]